VDTFLDLPPDTLFPLENLPWGVAKPNGKAARPVVRLGDWAVDLGALEEAGLLEDVLGQATPFSNPTLNAFMAMGSSVWTETRKRLQALLSGQDPALQNDPDLLDRALIPLGQVEMQLPARIGDYTDFYSSRAHATNVGTMFRGPDNALQPNWLHLPVGYHGRASSVVVSGTPVRRPLGQLKPEDGPPTFGASRLLDIELEMGFFVGTSNALGTPIPAASAEEHIFGVALVNDWSARDIQKWEYVPLGPFLGKSFCTTVSPWITPLDALEPVRVQGETQDPEPLPYLRVPGKGHFDVTLDVHLQTAAMSEPQRIARSNFRHLYWSMAQQLVHHASNGCPMRPGDLLASGTISGDDPSSYGSLLELTWRGENPIDLGEGGTRTFLQDGDTVVLTAYADLPGGKRIGLGEARGTIAPAPDGPTSA
jgi:fumarylacetoacetase